MGFARDSYLVRIKGRIVETLLQHGFQLRGEQVLHLLSGLVHVVGCDVEKLVEVEFPEAVQADDSHRIGYAGCGQGDLLFLLRNKALTEQ
jgi:hypothetical protein